MGPLAPTLAERLRDPRNINPAFDNPGFRRAVLQADRLVLDEDALRLGCQLATGTPREIRRTLDNIDFVTRAIWIEFPFIPIGKDGERLVISSGRGRLGMLIRPDPENSLIMDAWCVEEVVDEERRKQLGNVVMWPIGVDIRPPGLLSTSCLDYDPGHQYIWGFLNTTKDVSCLKGRAFLIEDNYTVPLESSPLGYGPFVDGLSGWANIVVGMLAMLQTVATVGQEERPPGHVLVGGRMRPRLTICPLTLQVPRRIRNVAAYARRKLAETATGKRLHEVRAHYRHLAFQPRPPGWMPVIIEGQMMWRKRIDSHLRGDPALGVIEHDFTVVHGPDADSKQPSLPTRLGYGLERPDDAPEP